MTLHKSNTATDNSALIVDVGVPRQTAHSDAEVVAEAMRQVSYMSSTANARDGLTKRETMLLKPPSLPEESGQLTAISVPQPAARTSSPSIANACDGRTVMGMTSPAVPPPPRRASASQPGLSNPVAPPMQSVASNKTMMGVQLGTSELRAPGAVVSQPPPPPVRSNQTLIGGAAAALQPSARDMQTSMLSADSESNATIPVTSASRNRMGMPPQLPTGTRMEHIQAEARAANPRPLDKKTPLDGASESVVARFENGHTIAVVSAQVSPSADANPEPQGSAEGIDIPCDFELDDEHIVAGQLQQVATPASTLEKVLAAMNPFKWGKKPRASASQAASNGPQKMSVKTRDALIQEMRPQCVNVTINEMMTICELNHDVNDAKEMMLSAQARAVAEFMPKLINVAASEMERAVAANSDPSVRLDESDAESIAAQLPATKQTIQVNTGEFETGASGLLEPELPEENAETTFVDDPEEASAHLLQQRSAAQQHPVANAPQSGSQARHLHSVPNPPPAARRPNERVRKGSNVAHLPVAPKPGMPIAPSNAAANAARQAGAPNDQLHSATNQEARLSRVGALPKPRAPQRAAAIPLPSSPPPAKKHELGRFPLEGERNPQQNGTRMDLNLTVMPKAPVARTDAVQASPVPAPISPKARMIGPPPVGTPVVLKPKGAPPARQPSNPSVQPAAQQQASVSQLPPAMLPDLKPPVAQALPKRTVHPSQENIAATRMYAPEFFGDTAENFAAKKARYLGYVRDLSDAAPRRNAAKIADCLSKAEEGLADTRNPELIAILEKIQLSACLLLGIKTPGQEQLETEMVEVVERRINSKFTMVENALEKKVDGITHGIMRRLGITDRRGGQPTFGVFMAIIFALGFAFAMYRFGTSWNQPTTHRHHVSTAALVHQAAKTSKHQQPTKELTTDETADQEDTADQADQN